MNTPAPVRARLANDVYDTEQSPSLAVCEQMVRVLDAQLADLRSLEAHLTQVRERWSERTAEMRGGMTRLPKAPHGAVKLLVLQLLENKPEGLATEEVLAGLNKDLPSANKNSVRQALDRLRVAGKVTKFEARWCLQAAALRSSS